MTSMRRPALFASGMLFVGLSVLAAGCFDTSPVYLPNGAECGGLTQEDAGACEGGVCLGLSANAQEMAGICSASCGADSDCTPHDHCISIQGQGPFCLRACNSDDDCYDRFVCRLASIGSSSRFCLVDPIGP